MYVSLFTKKTWLLVQVVVLFTVDNKSAEILIKVGADLNALGADYGNILQAVAFTSDNKSRRNVNAQGGEYGNALQMVVSRGQKTIVKILIKVGRRYTRSG